MDKHKTLFTKDNAVNKRINKFLDNYYAENSLSTHGVNYLCEKN